MSQSLTRLTVPLILVLQHQNKKAPLARSFSSAAEHMGERLTADAKSVNAVDGTTFPCAPNPPRPRALQRAPADS
jgi:hypothetical protein